MVATTRRGPCVSFGGELFHLVKRTLNKQGSIRYGLFVDERIFLPLDSRFYHQLIRRGCSSIAHLITYPCLKLRKGSLPARYVFMAVVFAVSALFHLLSDIALGIPAHESGAVLFFCCQTPAIMFEDAAKAVFQWLAGKIGGVATRKNNIISYSELSLPGRVLIRALGYSWVVIWLTCISPVWIYPAMQRDTGIPLIPF